MECGYLFKDVRYWYEMYECKHLHKDSLTRRPKRSLHLLLVEVNKKDIKEKFYAVQFQCLSTVSKNA